MLTGAAVVLSVAFLLRVVGQAVQYWLLIGIFWLPESRSFTAWISTALHLALASVVLIWGWHQLHNFAYPNNVRFG